jgi:uncharacterized protein with HEPN domain
MSERGVKLYLADIEEALGKIEQYTSVLSFKQFASSQQVVDAVVRNKVIHEYFGVDEEILWKTIQEDLPLFREQIAKMAKGI